MLMQAPPKYLPSSNDQRCIWCQTRALEKELSGKGEKAAIFHFEHEVESMQDRCRAYQEHLRWDWYWY